MFRVEVALYSNQVSITPARRPFKQRSELLAHSLSQHAAVSVDLKMDRIGTNIRIAQLQEKLSHGVQVFIARLGGSTKLQHRQDKVLSVPELHRRVVGMR